MEMKIVNLQITEFKDPKNQGENNDVQKLKWNSGSLWGHKTGFYGPHMLL